MLPKSNTIRQNYIFIQQELSKQILHMQETQLSWKDLRFAWVLFHTSKQIKAQSALLWKDFY